MTEAPVIRMDVRGQTGSFAIDARFSAGAGVTVLFGRSGAGKSTLINMVAGLTRPRDGVMHL